jgi:hypothetical protein
MERDIRKDIRVLGGEFQSEMGNRDVGKGGRTEG